MSFLFKCRQCTFMLLAALAMLSACAKPLAKFTVPSNENSAPATIQFANESTKSKSYLWDFGDGKTSTEENPIHRYATSGNFLVTLQARTKGKTALDSNVVQIIGPQNCLVEISTEYGTIVVSLSDRTPQHRDNFFKLAEEGFYTDLLFHRIIDGFVVQGGDPTGLGTGGPDYDIPAEFDPTLVHVRGALAAARKPDEENPTRDSNGSQFYIVSGRPVSNADLDAIQIRKGINYSQGSRKAYLENGGLPILDADYTVFGQVIEGLEVIDAIVKVATDDQDRPIDNVSMKLRVIN